MNPRDGVPVAIVRGRPSHGDGFQECLVCTIL